MSKKVVFDCKIGAKKTVDVSLPLDELVLIINALAVCGMDDLLDGIICDRCADKLYPLTERLHNIVDRATNGQLERVLKEADNG